MGGDVERARALARGAGPKPGEERLAALLAVAVKLTRQPEAMVESDVATLRAIGLRDAGVHDAVAVTAYFNFVNRMAQGLGIELEPE